MMTFQWNLKKSRTFSQGIEFLDKISITVSPVTVNAILKESSAEWKREVKKKIQGKELISLVGDNVDGKFSVRFLVPSEFNSSSKFKIATICFIGFSTQRIPLVQFDVDC